MSGDNYLGNPLIKKSNVRLSFTAEQIQEYAKCVKDPVHFIQNYVKIVNIDAGLVTFNLYSYQKKIVETAVDNRFVICKMPRQCGKTTTIVGVILWHILYRQRILRSNSYHP
jgi:superfamily II DNA or RNA helicase